MIRLLLGVATLVTSLPLVLLIVTALVASLPPAQAATVTVQGSVNIVPLDVATVTTGGTAVTALTAGHRTAGGFLLNPKGATIDLCINEVAAASGTTSAGSLVCIIPGASFNLAPSQQSVSVVTSDSAHPFAGEGYMQ